MAPLVVVSLLLAAATSVSACSDFLLNASAASNIISARTMDFEADLKTVVEVIPRGTPFQELPVYDCVECADYQWQSKYGFVAFNMFGLNVASDGLNERGLSAAWLYLVETKYPTPQKTPENVRDPSKPLITSLCSYILGNYATVDEVREGLEKIQIAEIDERIQVPILHSTALGRLPLHVSVHDAHGKSLVIEFINGETKLHDNINDVLTNDPPLDQQLDALRANGFKDLPGGYGSTERFLRLSVLNHHVPQGYLNAVEGATSYTIATEEQRGVSDALHLLNTVIRPPLSAATEWSVVRDHGRRKLYIQSTQNMVLRSIDLNQLDFASASSRHLIPVTFGNWSVDVTKALQNNASHAKTTDLPPRTSLEQLLEQMLHGSGFPPASQDLSVSAHTAEAPSSSASMSSFFLGMVAGAVLAVVMLNVSRYVAGSRRGSYQRIPDPEEVRYTA